MLLYNGERAVPTFSAFKEKVGRRLRPYPLAFGWARRAGNVLGMTQRIDVDYIFDVARRRGRDVFFLQIGANDGLMDDPLHFLIRTYGWRGNLMEPDPQLFERLRENYRGVEGLILVNAALSPTDGLATFYRIRIDDDLPAWCMGLGSFRRDVILSHGVPDMESRIIEDKVQSISFRSLMGRYKPPRLDLVLIDTEGYDLEILRQIELVCFTPELIVYEHKHLSERDRGHAADLLSVNGYRVQPTAGPNAVAIRR